MIAIDDVRSIFNEMTIYALTKSEDLIARLDSKRRWFRIGPYHLLIGSLNADLVYACNPRLYKAQNVWPTQEKLFFLNV